MSAGEQAVDPPGMEESDEFPHFQITMPLREQDEEVLEQALATLNFGENESGKKWLPLLYFAVKRYFNDDLRQSARIVAAALENRYQPIMGSSLTGQEVRELVGEIPVVDDEKII